METDIASEGRKVRISLSEQEFDRLVSAHTLIGEIIETYEILHDKEIMKRITKGEKAARKGKTIDGNEFLKLTETDK